MKKTLTVTGSQTKIDAYVAAGYIMEGKPTRLKDGRLQVNFSLETDPKPPRIKQPKPLEEIEVEGPLAIIEGYKGKGYRVVAKGLAGAGKIWAIMRR